jgi:hypothetical protein
VFSAPPDDETGSPPVLLLVPPELDEPPVVALIPPLENRFSPASPPHADAAARATSETAKGEKKRIQTSPISARRTQPEDGLGCH